MGLRTFLALLTGLVGTRVAGALAALLTQIVLARMLTPGDMGTYFLVVSLGSTFGVIMTCGYPALGITCLARYHALGRARLFAGFIAAARRDILLAATAIVAMGTGVLLFAPVPQALSTAILFGLAVAPAVALIHLQGAIANSTRRFSISFVPNFLLRPLALFVSVLALLVISHRLALADVLVAYLALAYLIAALQAYLLRPQGVFPIRQSLREQRPKQIWRRRAAILVIVTIFALAFADIVVLIAGLFMAPEDVAVVGICIRLAVLVGFVTQACHQFVLPDLTRALTTGSQTEIRPVLLRANLIALSVTGAALLGALIVGDYALRIFGSVYASGQSVLVLLLVSQILRAASGMNVHLLSLGGQQARTAWACVLSLAVLIVAAAILAPKFGPFGMGLAVVLSDTVWAFGSGLIAHRKLPRRGDIFALMRSGPIAAK